MELIQRILIFLFFISAICAQDVKIKKANINLDLSIGQEFDEKNEYMFGIVTIVKTDKKNNVYIFDRKEQSVKVYDSKGKYLKKIGRTGRGPSEFINVTNFIITQNEDYLFFDNTGKVFSLLNENGEQLIRKDVLKQSQLFFPLNIIDNNKNYIIISMDDIKKNKDIIHFVNKDFSRIEESITYKHFFEKELDESEKKIFFSNTASLLLINENKIYFAKGIYDGKIYQVEKKNGRWTKTRTINGFTMNKTSYKELKEGELYNSKNEPLFNAQIMPDNKYYILNNFSRGLYKLKNNKIINFVETNDRKYKYYLAEIYSSEMKLQNVYEINKIEYKSVNTNFDFYISHKDKDDNFYIVSYEKDYPIVKRAKLEFEK